MAVLTPLQLADMRKSLRTEWIDAIDFDKTLINGVFQAIEDEYERTSNVLGPGFKSSAATEISSASEPTKTFTNPQKKRIGRAYIGVKFSMEAS